MLTVNGNSQRPGSANDDNASFYAFDKPIHAVTDGTIVDLNDTIADNHGRTTINPPGNNIIVIRHGANRCAVYAHVKQGSVAALGLQLGDSVGRGQKIARLGNAGFSSEHICTCPAGCSIR